MNKDILQWLEAWYLAHCDGDWEHQYGIQITTLDNPGWSVEIDLPHGLFDAVQTRGEINRSVNNWLRYEFQELKFVGFCGPLNLAELLEVFRKAWGTESAGV